MIEKYLVLVKHINICDRISSTLKHLRKNFPVAPSLMWPLYHVFSQSLREGRSYICRPGAGRIPHSKVPCLSEFKCSLCWIHALFFPSSRRGKSPWPIFCAVLFHSLIICCCDLEMQREGSGWACFTRSQFYWRRHHIPGLCLQLPAFQSACLCCHCVLTPNQGLRDPGGPKGSCLAP